MSYMPLLTLALLGLLTCALLAFALLTPRRVLNAVLYYPDGDAYWQDFMTGLRAACRRLGMDLRLTLLPDPEIEYVAYSDAIEAEGARGSALLCRVPTAAVARRVAATHKPVIAAGSDAASLPTNVLHNIVYADADLFAALAASDAGPATGKRLVLVAPGADASYVPTASSGSGWQTVETTPDDLQTQIMAHALGTNVSAIYAMDPRILAAPNCARLLREAFPLAKLYAVCPDGTPGVDASASYDAFGHGFLAGVLYWKAGLRIARDIRTRVRAGSAAA